MNIHPLKQFLEEEISPSELVELLNGLYDEYIDFIILQQLTDNQERLLNLNTPNYIHTIRRLRDVFAECQ